MKPDSYEVTRDAKGKATAVPVFDQPYGMPVNGQIVQVPTADSGYANFLRDFDPDYASEFYDGIPTTAPTGQMSGGQVGKLWPSTIIGPDGEVLRGSNELTGDFRDNLLSSGPPSPHPPDKLQIAGTLVEGQPGKYHYMGGVHYDPTLAQINTSTPNALTPVLDPELAKIALFQDGKRMRDAGDRMRAVGDLTDENIQKVFDRQMYYRDFMNQGSLRGKLPGFLGPIATIGTATAAAFAPQETQAMSKEQADLLLQFDQGYSQVPKSKGEIFVNSVKDSTLSDMSMAPGTVAGERAVNALLPQKTSMVMQTPTQYGLQRVLPRMAGGLGMGVVAAPEVEGFLTGNSDYDYNKHGISLGPIDVGRIPYHFNRAVFGTADPISAIGNAFAEEMKNPSPRSETLRNSMDF